MYLVHYTWKGRPRTDLYCVVWDVKPYSLTHSNRIQRGLQWKLWGSMLYWRHWIKSSHFCKRRILNLLLIMSFWSLNISEEPKWNNRHFAAKSRLGPTWQKWGTRTSMSWDWCTECWHKFSIAAAYRFCFLDILIKRNRVDDSGKKLYPRCI